MKSIFQSICSFVVVRYFVKLFLFIFKIADRLISNLKYRALVKNCSNSLCHWSTQIKYGGNITVGRDTRIGPGCTLGAKGGITIGANVIISKNVSIETNGLDLLSGVPYKPVYNPVVIEDGVWIATQVVVLGGVTIGANSVIGAGLVVRSNVPPNSIVAGQKNKVIEYNPLP